MNRLLRMGLLFGALLSGMMFLPAQDRTCHTMEHLEILKQRDPGIMDRMQQIEQHTQRHVHQALESRAVITIPTVVHVVYRSGSQNISDAQILSQMQVLNDDFRRLNADADNVWAQAADVNVEFCLASVDPDGNPTNGITRTSTRKRTFSYLNDGVKFNSSGGKDAWPASDYLNIWVCDLGSGLLGYAQFPGGPAATDGVVVDFAYFGTIGTATAPFDLGRTTTHEVGHWLNLRHIWGDGACGVDDFVGDTPESDAPNYGCSLNHQSCGTIDMVQNYMDYSDDACMNLFTTGQSARMNTLFAPGGFRESLLNSNGCGSGGPSPTAEICDNGQDDDGDGQIDCADGDCATASNCTAPVTCVAPSGVSSSVTTQGKKKAKVLVSWNADPSASSYNAYLRSVGSSTWSSSNTTGTSVEFSGADQSVTYEYYVESVCTSGTASSAIQTVTARFDGSQTALKLYPNPASDVLVAEFGSLYGTQGQIEVLDLMGARVMQIDQVDLRAGYIELDLQHLQEGVYFLRIEDQAGDQFTNKFVRRR